MTRRLRPALDLVSDIGSLGFDLQHHDAVQIAHAVAILRKVNPDLFAWLVQALSESTGSTTGSTKADPAKVGS